MGEKMANQSKIKRAIGVGESSIEVFPQPVIASRAPTNSDTDYPVGQKWIWLNQEYTFNKAGTWIIVPSSPATLTDHAVLVGGGTSVIDPIAVGTNGQVLIGSTGADPAFATIGSANTSIAATLGAGTLSLDVDESYLQTATITVSTAELLALATTPKELVAAPGADKIVEFLGAKLILNYNSIQYTEAGDNMGIKYTDASGVQVSDTIECTGFIDQAADTVTSAVPIKDAIVAAAGCVNQALVLDNLNANFAAGNSEMFVQVRYRIITAGL